MNENINPARMLLSTITLFGGAMLLIVTPSMVVFGSTIGIFWLLFPKTLIVKRGGMIN